MREPNNRRARYRLVGPEPLEDRVVPCHLVGTWNAVAAYSDVWQHGDFAYLGSFQNQNGVQIIDISDPANPTFAANFTSTLTGADNQFRDIHVQTDPDSGQDIAFFSSDSVNTTTGTSGGVHIVDVTNPFAPVELFWINPSNGGYNRVHTITVDGDYLYESDTRTPVVKVFNIDNPAAPFFVRNITSPSGGPVHESTALNGRLYTAVINSTGYADIFDISNVGDTSVSVPLLGSFVTGSSAHTSWPSDDGNYVAVARETFGGDVKLWDIHNPAVPVLASTISVPTTEAYSAHQPMIVGNLLYVAWYQAGLRVYDIQNPSSPVLVGNHDTFPGPVSGYNGAWGVHSLLGPDRIVVVDMETGLYIFELEMASIAGQKYEDVNGNGSKDAGEPGLPGWTIFLDQNGNNTLDAGESSTTTDANGNYLFSGLQPDTYLVREVSQPGWQRTTTNPAPIAASVGDLVTNTTGVDFGNFRRFAISGQVFEDQNGNAARDAGEPALAGRTVFLDANGNDNLDGGEASASTDVTGTYSFTGLGAGTYRVRDVAPAGWAHSTPNPSPFNGTSGANVSGVDFGDVRAITISGQVYEDRNGNAAKDTGDLGIAGRTVFHDANNNGALDSGEPTAVTNSAGAYTFASLGPGTYRVREVLPSGWVRTTPNPAEFTVMSGEAVTGIDFGDFRLVTISGIVFKDNNSNGIQDPREGGLAGWTVYLDANHNGILDSGETSVTTNSTGAYTFTSVGPGTFYVRQVVKSGWTQTTSNPGPIDTISGLDVFDIHFGNKKRTKGSVP